jgi:hypothetical protein
VPRGAVLVVAPKGAGAAMLVIGAYSHNRLLQAFIGRSHHNMCCAGERRFAYVDDPLRASSRSAAQPGPAGTFAARVRV